MSSRSFLPSFYNPYQESLLLVYVVSVESYSKKFCLQVGFFLVLCIHIYICVCLNGKEYTTMKSVQDECKLVGVGVGVCIRV